MIYIMKRLYSTFFLIIIINLPFTLYAQENINHSMKVVLDPERHWIDVEDTIALPDSFLNVGGGDVHFIIHKGLHPESKTDGVTITPFNEKNLSETNANSIFQNTNEMLEHYIVNLPAAVRSFTVKYKGEIYSPLQSQREESDRTFRETSGIISTEGVYLASSTYWYPWFSDDLVTFSMDVHLPQGWKAISQGERISYKQKSANQNDKENLPLIHSLARRGNGVVDENKSFSPHIEQKEKSQTVDSWESLDPQDEIYLIAGKFTEYSSQAGTVQTLIFLRNPDEKLANKYLETGSQYLKMYSKLLGPYPYKKFALIENFWQTGYGMPSFTLLGSKIIRFPFILHSSYPHEILHNWWANGVFVDFSAGNWSEGLTAYLSDHLIKEQRGQGKEYRRTALRKYTDHVAKSKDFPLTEFRSRHSSATEAVGYGKTLMFFHMLRLQLGDKVFITSLQKFYQEYKFKRATFENLKEVFEKISGKNLQTEFDQWIKQTGAPEIRISNAAAYADDKGYQLTAVLEQVQEGPAYTLYIPITVILKDSQEAYQTTVLMDSKRLELSLHVPSKPLRLDVDPEFDLFRRLHRNETPPALSRAFGSEKVLIILPASAPEDFLNEYRKIAESWQKSPSRQMEIKLDNEINELPADRTVWLFGKENRFKLKIIDAMKGYNVSINDSGVSIGQSEIKRKNHSLVFTVRHPDEPDSALVWVSTDNPAALPGLGRKLPHYGKYSYLAFEGTQPSIVLKGQWPTVNSPMSIPVRQADGTVPLLLGVVAKPAQRKALAYLPAVFSEDRMMNVIRFLADDKMKGRGFGTAELDKAADFIASKFHEAGLEPSGGKSGSYFKEWKVKSGEFNQNIASKNIIGVIPGNNPDLEGQSVIISAHYDHLGLGWPDVRQGNKGKIHPGADDNASGVAILLELAQLLGKTWKPDRTVIFAAFTGEEAGRIGSKHYVENEKLFPTDKIMGVLNLDTVGRLGGKKLLVFGTGSAREWIHIFMGAGYVTGVPIEPVSDDFGSSDQKSFLDAGVPAVQFFSGPHLDYHSPTDTIDKIDKEGLIKVASVLKEAVEYLAARKSPLNSLLGTQRDLASEKSTETEQGRKISLGTIPDFAYEGKGIRIVGTLPDSPAEKAGLQNDDVITHLNGNQIHDLRSFSNLLKAMKPGDTAVITFFREGQEKIVRVEVVAR